MRYVAEITLRTQPFEAESSDEAIEAAYEEAGEIGLRNSGMPSIAEVQVFELEDTD